MHAARKTTEEQYQLVLECLRSGLTDCSWCRKNGINPNTFYIWISRLRKKACYPIPKPSVVPFPNTRPSQEIVKVDILPEELPCKPPGQKNAFIPAQTVPTGTPSIEIKVNGSLSVFPGQLTLLPYMKKTAYDWRAAMIGDISIKTNLYIICRLSSRYFYPHLFERALILGCFQEKYKDKNLKLVTTPPLAAQMMMKAIGFLFSVFS